MIINTNFEKIKHEDNISLIEDVLEKIYEARESIHGDDSDECFFKCIGFLLEEREKHKRYYDDVCTVIDSLNKKTEVDN